MILTVHSATFDEEYCTSTLVDISTKDEYTAYAHISDPLYALFASPSTKLRLTSNIVNNIIIDPQNVQKL